MAFLVSSQTLLSAEHIVIATGGRPRYPIHVSALKSQSLPLARFTGAVHLWAHVMHCLRSCFLHQQSSLLFLFFKKIVFSVLTVVTFYFPMLSRVSSAESGHQGLARSGVLGAILTLS